VTTSGDGAFFACIGLANVTIPAGVTIIGDYAFFNCPLDTVTFNGRNITSAWNDAAFSTGGIDSGGSLWNAYHTSGGGSGTYTWDGSDWNKSP
jgi:hypothetical protein